MAEIDTLEVKIKANAAGAAKSLQSLATALNNVKKALSSTKDGITATQKLSKSISDVNNAISHINNEGTKRLQFMANTLNNYANACQKLKATGALGGAIKNIQKVSAAVDLPTKSETVAPEGGEQKADQTASAFQRLSEIITKVRFDLHKLGMEFDKGFMNTLNGLKANIQKVGKAFSDVFRIAKYRAIRAALKAVSEAFSEGLTNAYGFSKQSDSFTRLADTLDRIKSITSQMVNQLGAFFGELKQFALPAIEWIVEKVRAASENITQLLAALNGETYYLQAQYVAQAWDDSVDAVKKYKAQLLGLDELNNLSTQSNSSKKEIDYKTLYKEVEISEKYLAIAEKFDGIKQQIDEAMEGLNSGLLAGLGELAIGAVLLFCTSKKLLGLGMMIHSGYLIGDSVDWDWETLRSDIKKIFKSYKKLITKVAVGMAAVGTILLFVPTQRLRGISMIVASGVLMTANVTFNWDSVKTDVETAFQKYSGLFAGAGAVAMIAGILLLFTPKFLLGLGLLVGGGLLVGETISFNWDGILKGLQDAWKDIKAWWNNTVVKKVQDAVKWIEEKTGIDWNGDGWIGDGGGGSHTSGGGGEHGGGGHSRGGTTTTTTTTTNAIKYPELVTSYNKYVDSMHEVVLDAWKNRKASGGIVPQGSLFYAGERGAEFVSNIGTTSAVANTGQMTEAIYKAAYMGMSQALKENGGMNGFEPATTDDLFIAMKKKASNFNKRTGTSAFA